MTWPSATASATATVAEVFPSTATASATAQNSTFGRPLTTTPSSESIGGCGSIGTQ